MIQRAVWAHAAALVLCLSVTLSQALAQGDVPTTRPGATPAVRALSLQSAIESALRSNPGLQAAGRDVIKARGSVNESRSAFLPTLSADLTLTHLDQGVSAQLGPDPAQSITVVRQDQKSATVTAALPIDAFGLIRSAASLSEFQYLIARLEYNRQRNQLVQDVTAAYYDALRAEAFVAVTTQAETNARERLRMAEAYLNAGTGTKFDVVRAQTELANAEQNVLSARNRVSLAQAALNRLIGLDQATPLKLESTLPSSAAEGVPEMEPALEEAYRSRPEILQADAGIRAAEKGFVLAQRSVLPSIGLAWNLQYTPDTGAFGRKNSWAAVARASVPIFDGGVANARKQQARAGIEAATLGRRQALDGVALDVRQAYLSFKDASDRLKVANAGLTQAEEAYRLAQVRYKAGVTMTPGGSPLLEISDAQTALTQAQTNQINALYDIEIARARLMRALGRYAYGPEAGPGLQAPNKAMNSGARHP
jgi:outer membrane protein TolC